MTDRKQGEQDRRAAIDEAAQRFHAIELGDDTEEKREDREKWLQESDEHLEAYERLKRQHAEAAILKQSAKFGVDRPAEASAADEQAAEPNDKADAPKRFAPKTAWVLVGAVAASLAIFAARTGSDSFHALLGGPSSPGDEVKTIATLHGEVRNVQLADGSTVTLDTDSRLEVAMTRQERRVHLAAGRARIAVVADPRPFHVDAGNGALVTNQAVLDVSYDDQRRVILHLISGQAEVRSALRPAILVIPARILMTGHPVAYDGDTSQVVDVPVEMKALDRSQWPEGWVDARSIPLAELIEEANRYAPAPIVIDDPDLAAMAMTGRYKVADTDVFVRRLAETLDLRIDRHADGIHLLRK